MAVLPAPLADGLASPRAVEPAGAWSEVVRLRRENRRLAQALEHIRSGARIALEELDTQALANAFARQAAQMLSAARAWVGLVENDVILVRAMYAAGRVQTVGDVQFAAGEGAAGRALQLRQAVVSHDPEGDGLAPAYLTRRLTCRSVVSVPILNHQSNVLGVIEVHDRKEGGAFGPHDVQALQTLAMQAAVGFARSQLFDRMAEWAQSLESLLAFNAAVNEHLDSPALVRRLVENAARFLKADGGMAGLVVPSSEGHVVVSDAYWHRGTWHECARTWKPGEGLPGFILVSEFPYVGNAYRDDRLADRQLIEQFGVQRALCVPIKDAGDNVMGFFELHKCEDQPPFTWQDAAFLESLANTTAVAIRNAQLLKALEFKNRQIQALSADHLRRLEEERRRIARELHDEAGQMLIGVKLGLQVLAHRLPSQHPAVRAELDRLREQINSSAAMLKDIARQLRPPTLDELGLGTAIRQLAADFEARSSFEVHLNLTEPKERLSPVIETALFRVAQEALTNVVKHANASHVWLSLTREGQTVRLWIVDDGCGFDVNARRDGLGLLGMKERVELLGGRFAVESHRGEGTQVSVTLRVDGSPCSNIE